MPASRSKRDIHIEQLKTYLETVYTSPGSRYLCLVFYIEDVYAALPHRNTHFTYTADSEDGKENVVLILHIFFTV